jgi:TRAP-type C4-dicarboxylate transport system permease small subunit
VSHGVDIGLKPVVKAPVGGTLGALLRAMDFVNLVLLRLAMVALVLTALVLTYSVVSRYFFQAPTDWQDEASVFMLVGVTFFCTAYVQSQRGHIGIDALADYLPARVNAVRRFIVDAVSCLFCAFFAWKSWTLFYEAWVDGQTTSSTFAPPLWIPYAMMAAGMSILTLQIVLQVAVGAGIGKNEAGNKRGEAA